MSLVRLVARPMMAAIFVIQGTKNLKNPDPLVPVADELTTPALPRVKERLPQQVADRVPEDPRTWVRVNAAGHVLGGLMLASGRYSRLGAVLLSTTMLPTTWAGHPFWKQDDPSQKIHFLKNVSIAGGLLLAVVDTEGKPGLWWRAKRGCTDVGKASTRVADEAAKASKHAVRTSKRTAKDTARDATSELESFADAARRAAPNGHGHLSSLGGRGGLGGLGGRSCRSGRSGRGPLGSRNGRVRRTARRLSSRRR